MRSYTFPIWVLLCSPFAGPAVADTVVLVNGDRVSGRVQRLEEGKLVMRSDLMGTVRLDWSDVQAFQSDSEFSILTGNGTRFEGLLNREGSETVVTGVDDRTTVVQSPNVARLVRGARGAGAGSLIEAVDGAADIGYSVARGNQNQMQSSLGARAVYASARYKFLGRLDSLFARQEGARSQSRHALNARIDRIVNSRLFTYGLSAFERNERRRLNLRSRLGGGAGWRLRDSRATELSLIGGLAYVHERYKRAENRETGEGFFGVEWDTRLIRGIRLSLNLTAHPDLFDRSNVRAEFDSTLRVPIAGRFTYSLRVFDRFHSRPVESVERNDYGLVSGFGVTF